MKIISLWNIAKIVRIFFSIQTYIHVQFEQLHKNIQKRNEIYEKWYTQKQYLDTKLFVISRKQTNKQKTKRNKINKKKQKGDVGSKSIESFIIVVVMSCRD